MGKNSRIVLISIITGTIFMPSLLQAHGGKTHDKDMMKDPQMRKLHAMMPVFSVASGRLEMAIDKTDLASVEAEAGKILHSIPDLKKSKPHKNLKNRKKFVELAGVLETSLNETVAAAKQGDFPGAKRGFLKVEESCANCHAGFRD